ncbi:MAG: hypothetical protein DYG89_09540 [Caldilinea sp. CFX5]|nr:hypothetical protein [Caldilinea sp. CFX5]
MNNLFGAYNEYELTQQRLAERRQEAARWRAVRSAQTPGNFWRFLHQLRFLFSMESRVITWSPRPAPVDKALYG